MDLSHSDLCEIRSILLYSEIDLRDCLRSRLISLAVIHAADYIDLIATVPSRSISVHNIVLDQDPLALIGVILF